VDYEQIRVADELSECVQRVGASLAARNAWLAGEDHGGTAGSAPARGLHLVGVDSSRG
jgi:hypothetical protein